MMSGKREMDEISRVTRTREQAQANYDMLSRRYDLIEGNWEARPRRLGLELLRLQAGERLLEIGCGTGRSLLEVPEGTDAAGVDLSRGMLELTRARLMQAGKPAKLAQSDALQLPFAGDTFDAVFAAFTLELMDTPEMPLTLKEIKRVLKPGGRVGVVSTSKLGGNGWMLRLYEWTHARFPAAVDCRPIYARRALEEAGFTVEEWRLLRLTGLGVEAVVGRA